MVISLFICFLWNLSLSSGTNADMGRCCFYWAGEALVAKMGWVGPLSVTNVSPCSGRSL